MSHMALCATLAVFLHSVIPGVAHAAPEGLVGVLTVGGSKPFDFSRPLNVFVDDSNRIYVADWNTSTVYTMDRRGGLIRKWGTPGSGDGELDNPAGLCADKNGNVYVCDSGNHRIVKYSSAGKFMKSFGKRGTSKGELQTPVDIDPGLDGNLYVADSVRDRVLVFRPDGKLVREWGKSGTKSGQMRGAEEIDAAPNGNVYFVDRPSLGDLRGDRIQEFTPEGKLIKDGGVSPSLSGGHVIRAFAVQWDGAIVASDDLGNKIRVFKDGKLQLTYGVPGSDPGQLGGPVGISVGPDGLIWVGEVHNNRVQAFKRTSGEGGVTPAKPSPGKTPSGAHATGFLPSNDGYPFPNESSWSEWDQFTDYFGDAVKNSDGTVKFVAEEFYDDSWRYAGDGGTCFGLASTSMSVFSKLLVHPLVPSGAKLHDIANPAPKKTFGKDDWFLPSPQVDLARSYQPRQEDMRAVSERGDSRDSGVKAILRKIEAEIDAKRPALISIWGTYHGNTGGHAVVAYAYSVSGDKTQVRIYDCNHVGAEEMDKRSIEFDTKNGTWAYQLFDDTRWNGPLSNDAMCAVQTTENLRSPGLAPWTIAENIWGSVYSDVPLEPVSDWRVTPHINTLRTASTSTSVDVTAPSPRPLNISVKGATNGVTVGLFSANQCVGLRGVNADSPRMSVDPGGAATVTGSAGRSPYRYAVSREDSTTSRGVVVSGLSADGGSDSFQPDTTLSSVSLANQGGAARATVRVDKRGEGGRPYEASNVPLAAGDAARLVVPNWSTMPTDPPQLGVDRGGDGTVDQTITLKPVSNETSGTSSALLGRGGSPGDSGGLLFGMGVLALLGSLLALVVKQRATDSSNGITNQEPGSAVTPYVHGTPTDDSTPTYAQDGIPELAINLLVKDRRWPIMPGQTATLGRRSDNDIVISDASVSRHHAEIVGQPDGSVYIIDRESTVGTFVDGARIAEGIARRGSTIRFGDVECHLE
jgi:sugar lactone lactonase YvrE